MLTIQGEDKKPQLWVGGSLRNFGVNVYGEPLFRVVWAPSRMRLIGGKHTERSGKMASDREMKAAGRDLSVTREWVGYKWYPLYPRKQCYVLEKWLSPIEYGGTKETYELQQKDAETGLLVSGPYPTRGEYFECHQFPEGYPAFSAVESVIRLILFGRTFSIQEKKAAIVEADKRERLALVKRGTDVILDSQPAFGHVAASMPKPNPARKKAEDYKLTYAAEDLGLPVGHNKVFTKSAVQRG